LLPAIQQVIGHGEPATDSAVVASLVRERPEGAALLESLGVLYTRGYPVEWSRLYPAGGSFASLPTYPFQRERYWIEPPVHAAKHRARPGAAQAHPLLGEPIHLSSGPGPRVWEALLSTEELPYLADHRVQTAVVLPGTAYLEMALAAARLALDGRDCVVEEVTFHEVLVLREGEARVVQMALEEVEQGVMRFRVSSRPGAEPGPNGPSWVQHASGRFRAASAAAPAPRAIADIRARIGEALDREAYYAGLATQGLSYGPAFQGIQELWRSDDEAFALLRLPREAAHAGMKYQLHPALLDAAFQVLGAPRVLEDARREAGAPSIPVRVGALRVHREPGAEVYCHGRLLPGDGQASTTRVDLVLLDASGDLVAEVSGLEMKRLDADKGRTEAEEDVFLAHAWQLAEPLPTAARPDGAVRGRWLLLAPPGGLADALATQLEAQGEEVLRVRPADATEGATSRADGQRLSIDLASPSAFDLALREASAGNASVRGIIHMLAAEDTGDESLSSLEAAQLRGYGSALLLSQALSRTSWGELPPLWLITRGTQVVGADPGPIAIAHAPLWGLGRTLTLELPQLRCQLLDLAPAGFAGEADALAQELLAQHREEEVALRKEGRYVGRLLRQAPAPRPDSIVPAGGRPFRLEIATPGVFDGLSLRGTERRPPGPGEVEIRVEAASLNFNDVLKVLGLYPGVLGDVIPLGSECAGRIVALGEGVCGLSVGQEVVATAPFSFGSYTIAKASAVVERPKRLRPEEAAALPVVTMAAWYVIHDLGRLQRGERILIHSAAGGVGLAAVQMAQRVGAQVFATAGTPAKRAYLRDLGIEHVMDSRATGFVEEILRATGGEGVEMVMNSLSGEGIKRSLSVLAEDGRFFELGKRDIYAERSSLELSVFRKRISYHAVDLLGLAARRPERFRALFQRVMQAVDREEVRPLPTQVFPISRAEEAFRLMAQGQHIGKLVLTLDDPGAQVALPAGAVQAQGSYLITGGLGALGLSVATWLVEKGARCIALLGRQGVTTEAQRGAIASLEAAGARVLVLRADVADQAQLAAAIDEAEKVAPLRGVVHAAGLLEDGLLDNQTVASFRAVSAAKIAGAFNLHVLTRHRELAFFVLYSSAAALLGSVGQANYAAANAFLDALAHHRKAQGLPALSINWAAFTDVGLAALQDNRADRLAAQGQRELTAAQGVALLERLLAADAAQIGVVPLDFGRWLAAYPKLASSTRLVALIKAARGDSQGQGSGGIREALRAAATGERKALVEQFLREALARVLRMDAGQIEQYTSFKELGLDSLTGLELRNQMEATFGLRLPASIIWTHPTPGVLASHLLHVMDKELVERLTDGATDTPVGNDQGEADEEEIIL
jgi:NADPH:quinone reductase-like Zn-dependent oxidoreductase/acyl carrier protein